jgi:hypothetical protein
MANLAASRLVTPAAALSVEAFMRDDAEKKAA